MAVPRTEQDRISYHWGYLAAHLNQSIPEQSPAPTGSAMWWWNQGRHDCVSGNPTATGESLTVNVDGAPVVIGKGRGTSGAARSPSGASPTTSAKVGTPPAGATQKGAAPPPAGSPAPPPPGRPAVVAAVPPWLYLPRWPHSWPAPPPWLLVSGGALHWSTPPAAVPPAAAPLPWQPNPPYPPRYR